MGAVDYRAEVEAIYFHAYACYIYGRYYIQADGLPLGEGATPDLAWQSAYETIKES